VERDGILLDALKARCGDAIDRMLFTVPKGVGESETAALTTLRS
jgi:hypothetical protein